MSLRDKLKAVFASALLIAGAPHLGQAAVVQNLGANSAVSLADATADFEDLAALGASYSENGMLFERVDLSTNNNGCGYAGCGYAFTAFSGNYFYGAGRGGYLQISALDDQTFDGLEFGFGWNAGSTTHNILWTAFLDGSEVGTGTYTRLSGGAVIGFTGLFDTLQITSRTFGRPNLRNSYNTPGIDLVRASFDIAAVPLPASAGLLGAALMVGGFVARRRRATATTP